MPVEVAGAFLIYKDRDGGEGEGSKDDDAGKKIDVKVLKKISEDDEKDVGCNEDNSDLNMV